MDEQNQQQALPPQQPPLPPQNVNPVPPPQHKNWIKWALIIVFVALLASITTYFVLNSQTQKPPPPQIVQPIPSPTPTPDPTANWKTYTNPNLKFTVKYPSDWEAFQKKDITETFIVGFGEIGAKDFKGDPFSIVDIVVKEDPKGKVIDLEKIPETVGMEEVMGSFKVDKYFEWSDTIIDGVKAKRVYHLYCQSGRCQSVLFKRNSKVYGITMNQAGEYFLKIFNQILSTFRFTD